MPLRNFSVAVIVVVAVLSYLSDAVAEQDHMFKCRVDQNTQQVSCTVITDSVTLESISINRGNCESPTVTPEEKMLVDNHFDSSTLRHSIREEFGSGVLFSYHFAQFLDKMVAEGKLNQQEALATFKFASDPSGNYKFGDQFSFTYGQCRMIEFSFATSVGSETHTLY